MILTITTKAQNMDSGIWNIGCHCDNLPYMSSVRINSKIHLSTTLNKK